MAKRQPAGSALKKPESIRVEAKNLEDATHLQKFWESLQRGLFVENMKNISCNDKHRMMALLIEKRLVVLTLEHIQHSDTYQTNIKLIPDCTLEISIPKQLGSACTLVLV